MAVNKYGKAVDNLESLYVFLLALMSEIFVELAFQLNRMRYVDLARLWCLANTGTEAPLSPIT